MNPTEAPEHTQGLTLGGQQAYDDPKLHAKCRLLRYWRGLIPLFGRKNTHESTLNPPCRRVRSQVNRDR